MQDYAQSLHILGEVCDFQVVMLHIYAKLNFWYSCGFFREALWRYNEHSASVTA
jgi:hypothetical protein